MSVWVYKKNDDGNIDAQLIDAKRLQSSLAAGWSVTEDCKEDLPTFDEVDTNGTGKISNKEIRAAAKEAGIDEYDTKRISTLKDELGLGAE